MKRYNERKKGRGLERENAKKKGKKRKTRKKKCRWSLHTERARDLFITTNPPTDNPIGSPRRCIRNCNS